MSVFVDSSVWFAAANVNDRNNAAAKQLLGGSTNLITTDHVLVESWLVIQRHIQRRAAEGYWEGIRRGLAVVEKVRLADLNHAWVIGEAFPDQEFSTIVDRTGFAVWSDWASLASQASTAISRSTVTAAIGTGVRDSALTPHDLRSRRLRAAQPLVNHARSR